MLVWAPPGPATETALTGPAQDAGRGGRPRGYLLGIRPHDSFLSAGGVPDCLCCFSPALPVVGKQASFVPTPYLRLRPVMRQWCPPGSLPPPAVACPCQGRQGWPPRRSKSQGQWLRDVRAVARGMGRVKAAGTCSCGMRAALLATGKHTRTALDASDLHAATHVWRTVCTRCCLPHISPVWPVVITAEVGKEPGPALLVSTPPTLV